MCASVRACVRACVQTSARSGRPDVRGGEAACARLVQSPRRRRRPVRLVPRHPGRRRSAVARPTRSAGPWSARLRRYLRRKGTLCTVRRAVLAGGTHFVVSAALRLQRRRHSCTGTDLAAATSAPGPGSPQPHLHRDRARRSHICTGTGLALPHLHRDWARRVRCLLHVARLILQAACCIHCYTMHTMHLAR